MMGDRGTAGLRAVGVLLIVGMDGAAVPPAQQTQDHQPHPGHF